jgi:hypothetical protein
MGAAVAEVDILIVVCGKLDTDLYVYLAEQADSQTLTLRPTSIFFQ